MQNVRLFRCLLISPGDVTDDREAVARAVEQWNAHAGKSLEARIDLVRWEVHGVPDASGAPQAILNRQLVDECDCAVALFWTRLGTPTASFPSGSIEEIERMRARRARVLMYFKNAPLPADSDLKQVEAVRAFREKMKKESLLGEYGSSTEVASLVERHLTTIIVELQATSDPAPVPDRRDNTRLTAATPDVRVSVRAVGLIPDVRQLGFLFVIRVENHSPVRVFVASVGVKYRGKGQYGIVALDAVTGAWVKRELDPGARVEVHALAASILDRKDDTECAFCLDEIGREFRSSEEEMKKALKELAK